MTLAICLLMFLLSLPLASTAGRSVLPAPCRLSPALPSHIIDLIDHYVNLALILVVFLEAVMIMVYSVGSFMDDLTEITRSPAVRRASPVFYFFYYFLIPAALGVVRQHGSCHPTPTIPHLASPA